VDALVQRFTASVGFDRRLAACDIEASLAHARMLAGCRIISRRDLAAIERGMRTIRREIDAGRFRWSIEAEDVHLNIERRLIALVGEAGKRLHTARSRNDQVATDVRLWLRGEIDAIDARLRDLQSALAAQAERHAALVMPGLHAPAGGAAGDLRPPSDGVLRDAGARPRALRRVPAARERAAARRGGARRHHLPHRPRARGARARLRGRRRQLARRGVRSRLRVEFCAHAALAMMHLSRFAEELVLWTSPRFGFVRLPDRFCTGSSIMPQKKNPDVPELVRGKSARVSAAWSALLMLMKAQPLAYNKDNQEDKEPLFDAVDTLKDSLAVFAELVAGLAPVPAAMRAAAQEGFATATDLADYLVRKGVAFRDAHGIVARAVREAESRAATSPRCRSRRCGASRRRSAGTSSRASRSRARSPRATTSAAPRRGACAPRPRARRRRP
jgi:argininosuccinate lyase